MNPLDAHFRSLDLESMAPVASDSAEFAALSAYARETHGSTHSYYQTAVHAAFRVRRYVKVTYNGWVDMNSIHSTGNTRKTTGRRVVLINLGLDNAYFSGMDHVRRTSLVF